MAPDAPDLLARRWHGQRGRIETWYATATLAGGEGLWLHHEIVAPPEGDAYGHGWVVLFPAPDAGVEAAPLVSRHGPSPVGAGPWYAAGDVEVSPGVLRGRAGGSSWALEWSPGPAPLYSVPAWAWRTDALPGHVEVAPAARLSGRISVAGRDLDVDGSGAVAHTWTRHHPPRWVWLHADLAPADRGAADPGPATCELVGAPVPGAPALGLRPFLRLRRPGAGDWPRSLLAPARGRVDVRLASFTAVVREGNTRLRAEARLPDRATVTMRYDNPDGTTAQCANSERASALVVLEERSGGTWRTTATWELAGRAHAEIGGPVNAPELA